MRIAVARVIDRPLRRHGAGASTREQDGADRKHLIRLAENLSLRGLTRRGHN
jgi:hypothetical protein